MNRLLLSLGCLALLAGFLFADSSNQPDTAKLPPAARGVMDFERDIRPIFQARCLSCHGTEKQKGGLRLDGRDGALKGSNSGTVITPGQSGASRLIHVVGGLDAETRMPPYGKPLSAAEVGRLRAWIDQGAKWPAEKTAARSVRVRAKHWAFLRPERSVPPPVAQAGWVRNPIDAFILARLEAEKIAPAPEADRVTLIRRVSLDLLGLPPTPEQVAAFVNDHRPGAYERLVDRLLASPHHGERWGRHWLDLARYADSDGFEKDTGRPFAWRYRHWVIAALNRDLPFDQFTVEQLAGDLLPSATVEQKVATGFHRNTLTNKEGGVDPEQFRVEQVVDRVNTTAKVFLGVTLGCAQCHDHKYDPFSQREYYQMFAFFNSDREVNIPAPLPEAEARDREIRIAFFKKEAALRDAIASYLARELPTSQQTWETTLKPEQKEKLPPNVRAILAVAGAERSEQQKTDMAAYYARIDRKLAGLRKALAAYRKSGPATTQAQTLAQGPARKTHVLIRGDFLRPGVAADPGTPEVLSPLKASGKRTRLDLARWIVDPANPLTARVIVNWLWEHHFGRGLVATPEDFGTQGQKPSHPQLLDWLATEFIGQKWSLKAMHKLILTSATYRQSSRTRPELQQRDAHNTLLARQNRLRLEAEVIRDVALAASGLLVPRIGGPSVRPPQPSGISELTYAGSARWIESKGPDRYRRGLYTWFQRTSPYPMLMTFDSPDSNVCCVRRDRTNTPLQALTLLNDTVFTECAQALGRRILDLPAAKVEERIDYAFRLCLARRPATSELVLLRGLYEDLVRVCRKQPGEAARLLGKMKPNGVSIPEAAAWVALARTVMNLDEFVTRE
jgi:mono/diheme cytochrome c family protein